MVNPMVVLITLLSAESPIAFDHRCLALCTGSSCMVTVCAQWLMKILLVRRCGYTWSVRMIRVWQTLLWIGCLCTLSVFAWSRILVVMAWRDDAALTMRSCSLVVVERQELWINTNCLTVAFRIEALKRCIFRVSWNWVSNCLIVSCNLGILVWGLEWWLFMNLFHRFLWGPVSFTRITEFVCRVTTVWGAAFDWFESRVQGVVMI